MPRMPRMFCSCCTHSTFSAVAGHAQFVEPRLYPNTNTIISLTRVRTSNLQCDPKIVSGTKGHERIKPLNKDFFNLIVWQGKP